MTAKDGHRIWAPSLRCGPNPLLALETRLLLERLAPLRASRFLDIACGTGRWMLLAQQRGSQVFGVDFCPEMLLEASRKPWPRRVPQLSRTPAGFRLPIVRWISRSVPSPSATCLVLRTRSAKWPEFRAKVAASLSPICTLAHSRPVGRVLSGGMGKVYEIDHYLHPIAAWETAAESAGLTLDWRLEAGFGEPEQAIFRRAGKDSVFSEMSRIPALLAMSWIKS